MIASLAAMADDRRLRTRAASFSLLSSLLLGYAVIYYDDGQPSFSGRRTLEASPEPSAEVAQSLAGVGDWDDSVRLLAKSHQSPPAMDEIPGEYIVKPWVGYAANDVWENRDQTKVLLASAQASTVMGANYLPRNAIDDPNLATRWASSKNAGDDAEWIQIDMGGPQIVAEVYVKWWDAYAQDYEIHVARERENCRSDGTSCPDVWLPVVSATGKSNADPTTDVFDDEDHALQGVRYVRLKMNTRATGYENFSVYYIRVYRKKMITGESQTGTSCGSTVSAVTNSLLSTYGGTLIQSYENAEFFAASMTEAQKDAMFADPCTFTVEPNYVVRARWNVEEEKRRRLAIPEFNLRDDNPPNWGLERISSYGKLNGKYTWVHEGMNTHMYIFDTGIYPDHSEWNARNGTSRLAETLICAGGATDYAGTNHGTHVASLAAGYKVGVAKAATIHPIQVLDANGEGSTASVLCGMEKLLQDGKDYNLANAPKKIKSVVNLSLGVNGKSDALDKAVKDMTDVGYTVVIAAGDNDDNACFFSPYDPTAIVVGALSNDPDGYNDKTATSNYGECVDVWAPGEDISGASNADEYGSALGSGTSVAAAFVSGASALFFESLFTEEYPIEEFSARVKEKVMNKAEINILGEIGHGSVNKVIQTTATRCLQTSHCDTGLTCLRDGLCVDLAKWQT